MDLFLSRFDNKVDGKGRVSVPAPFRTALATQPFVGVVLFPSPINRAIEGCGYDRMREIADSVDVYEPFSDEHDAFATSLLSRSHPLAFDGDGRIVLPAPLLQHAGIGDKAVFAGRGRTFQIWEPETFLAFESEQAERMREQAASFRWRRRQGQAPSQGQADSEGGA